MSRHPLLLLILWSACLFGESRPNIVFILADDLGYGEVGYNGQKIIRTPNVDRLAREGMIFTRHYCGNAVCSPSRTVLMTG
ncbi:MAG: sulfatase-like hydrolase/transferase, partial [Verrucomicrobiota bacterium]